MERHILYKWTTSIESGQEDEPLLKEFRDFIARGNVVDLAIGVIIGTTFNKIVTSLVNDIVMPPIGLILNHVNFTQLYINLSHKSYPDLAAAKTAGAPTINYGAFISTVIDFLIIAIVVFFIIREVNRLMNHKDKESPAPVEPTTKSCPYCCSSIPLKATRCPNCTSQLMD